MVASVLHSFSVMQGRWRGLEMEPASSSSDYSSGDQGARLPARPLAAGDLARLEADIAQATERVRALEADLVGQEEARRRIEAAERQRSSAWLQTEMQLARQEFERGWQQREEARFAEVWESDALCDLVRALEALKLEQHLARLDLDHTKSEYASTSKRFQTFENELRSMKEMRNSKDKDKAKAPTRLTNAKNADSASAREGTAAGAAMDALPRPAEAVAPPPPPPATSSWLSCCSIDGTKRAKSSARTSEKAGSNVISAISRKAAARNKA